MAVIRLADVFPRHVKRVVWYVVLAQFVVGSIAELLMVAAGMNWLQALLFVFTFFVLQGVAIYYVGRYALEPLDFLSRTVTHVSDQPHDIKPPNLNGTRHEHTGYKLMVDTIYAIKSKVTSLPATESELTTIQAAMLDEMPGGVVALNEGRTILFANSAAPVLPDANGEKRLQLDLESYKILDEWLTKAEASQVSATTTFRKLQTLPQGKPDRKVYDVAVSYQRNGAQGVETLLLFFDQTKWYAIGEESMDFMALAAHELRGPITVIRGYLEVLRPELDHALSDDQRQLFDRLDVSSSRLSTYVGNILNAAKFDRRHMTLHLQEDRVKDIYGLVADDMALRASTQGRLLSIAIPEDLPTVAADRGSISEVMANFVDNGIKYSREGGQVNVTAAVDGDFVRFSVQDFGIGIPSTVMSHLFSKFYRSHRSKYAISGTGLGLYISKAIIESHGGQVSVSSTEGEGSTFTFTLPVYATVADKLLANGQANSDIIETSSGWIKNHSMYRG